MMQRDTAEVEANVEPALADTTRPAPPPEPLGMPNVQVELSGTWELALVPLGGGATTDAVWTISEGAEGYFRAGERVDAALEITDRLVDADVFVVGGIVRAAEGDLPFEASGTLNGDTMTGEVTLGTLGTFELSGTRYAE